MDTHDTTGQFFAAGPWDLREPGFAAYQGHRFPVSGAARRLLVRLVRARGTVIHRDTLKEAVGESCMADSSIRGHVSDLRTALRAGLAGKVTLPADPVPGADRGDFGGWRLALG